MIEPKRAWSLVQQQTPNPSTRRVALDDAAGCVLAEDVTAKAGLPVFDNSAMDGFALRSGDTAPASPRRPVFLSLDAPVYAGDTTRRALPAGRACAIMTGAPIPRGADTVVPKEVACVENGRLVVTAPVDAGRHVRRGGEEAARGATVLRAGSVVNPGSVAVLASAGRATVRVCRKPRVCVIATGSETVEPGNRLHHGQIYDSNSPMLSALVRAGAFELVRVRRVRDRPSSLRGAVAAALRAGDVVVIAGGVSVGEHDYVRGALDACGVREVFWRVSQKPGKPLYFGRKGRRLVFGLPGNPASVFTCYHLYVNPALRRMSGLGEGRPQTVTRTLTKGVRRDGLRWRFLKAQLVGGGRVLPLPAQASHLVTSLASTDALIAIAPGEGSVGKGVGVDVFALTHGMEAMS